MLFALPDFCLRAVCSFRAHLKGGTETPGPVLEHLLLAVTQSPHSRAPPGLTKHSPAADSALPLTPSSRCTHQPWSPRVEHAPRRRRPSPAAVQSRRRARSRRRASPPREPSRQGAKPRTEKSRTHYKRAENTPWSSSSCSASWSSSRRAATCRPEARRHPRPAGTPRRRRPSLC